MHSRKVLLFSVAYTILSSVMSRSSAKDYEQPTFNVVKM